MPGPADSIKLTATEAGQLTAWVRAGTTPQRLVRRGRLIPGSRRFRQPCAGSPGAVESHHRPPLGHPTQTRALVVALA
jgi:hypothetical protein